MSMEELESLTPSSTSGWEEYVRRAIPDEAGSSPTRGVERVLPAPHPLPRRVRKGFFSPLFLEDARGARVFIPHHAVVRNHCSVPLRPPKAPGTWPPNPDLPHVRDVIVIAVRDASGNLQYGWYAREHAASCRLVRLPIYAVERLWRYVRETPGLQRSLLNEDLIDSTFASPTLEDFHATALLSFRRTHRVVNCFFQQRKAIKRKLADYEPSSPAHTLMLGTCTVCLEDNVELSDRNCCGSQGTTCIDCSEKLRSLCPVCDRSELNATYQCSVCNSEVGLREFGYPCITCQQCITCSNCYHQCAECVECDPVRASDEAACIY